MEFIIHNIYTAKPRHLVLCCIIVTLNLSVAAFKLFENIYPVPSKGFPGGTVVKNLPANAGDMNSVPGLGRCPGVGNGNQLQSSCLENSMDRGAWRATVHRLRRIKHS